MKRKNLTKVLAVTLCLTFALSTVAMAKTSTNDSKAKIHLCKTIIHPEDGEVPD